MVSGPQRPLWLDGREDPADIGQDCGAVGLPMGDEVSRGGVEEPHLLVAARPDADQGTFQSGEAKAGL